jgi:hypothetical protein
LDKPQPPITEPPHGSLLATCARYLSSRAFFHPTNVRALLAIPRIDQCISAATRSCTTAHDYLFCLKSRFLNTSHGWWFAKATLR